VIIQRPATRQIADPDTGEIDFDWQTKFDDAFKAISGPFPLRPFTVATLPDPKRYAFHLVYVTDASTSPCVAVSNGTNWKRLDFGATVT
jgi:hypothetical protein